MSSVPVRTLVDVTNSLTAACRWADASRRPSRSSPAQSIATVRMSEPLLQATPATLEDVLSLH